MTYSDLTRSIRSYKPDDVKKLLQEGVDVNFIDSTGETPLMNAVRCDRLDMAQLLLDKDADTTIQMHGRTVMDWAMQNDRQPAIALLQEHEQALVAMQQHAVEAFRHASVATKQETLKSAAQRQKLKIRPGHAG